ncbi:hypothetical protein FACS189481_1130 [Clostridia bacterium]|nr:hypothetical protein FACS189481_1130 [Clostridia bacterium]
MVNLKKSLGVAISCLMIFIPVNLSFAGFSQRLKDAGFSQRLKDKADAIARNTERMKNETNYKINSNGNCPKLEREVIKLVNQERERINEEREENGEEPLKILKVKNSLRKTARAKSKEMYKKNYFSHERPGGKKWYTIFDKIKNQLQRGENLLKGPQQRMPTAQQIFDGFKKSPKHYANMIADFDYIGVGFYCEKKDGFYHWYVTQHFMNFRNRN